MDKDTRNVVAFMLRLMAGVMYKNATRQDDMRIFAEAAGRPGAERERRTARDMAKGAAEALNRVAQAVNEHGEGMTCDDSPLWNLLGQFEPESETYKRAEHAIRRLYKRRDRDARRRDARMRREWREHESRRRRRM